MPVLRAATHARRRVEAPVFVVGCCNSGTTILWRALRAHPQLDGPVTEGQELTDLPARLRHFLGRQTSRLFAHPRFKDAYVMTERDADAALAQRVDAVYGEHCASGRRLIEKSPANSMRTRFLQAVFPDATFVIVARNGLAVSEGIVRKRAFDPERPHMAGLTTTLPEAAGQWLHANRRLLADRRHLRRSVVVRYEDLVARPAAVLSDVFHACGLDPRLAPVPAFETDLNARQVARLRPSERALVQALTGERDAGASRLWRGVAGGAR
jgi:hypothetical protein